MQRQSSTSHRTSVSLSSQTKVKIKLFTPLARLALVIIIASGFTSVGLLLLSMARTQSVQAAPPPRPLAEIMTGTVAITHTDSTTHRMSVFANGRITGQFLADNDEADNQIGTDNISATTIAVMFDQHTSPDVDVGSQLEFSVATSITLNTASSIPDFSEDSYVVYASQEPPYQITQRTLATNTHNYVIMELVIENTSAASSLTGGKLLYMVDIQAGRKPRSDKGAFDPARRLVYHTDYNANARDGYAMGISLLAGDLRGYGVLTDTHPDFPDPSSGDAKIETELNAPLFSPTDAPALGEPSDNLVSWLVANVPDLDPGQAAILAFGLCARTAAGTNANTAEGMATANLLDCFDHLPSSPLAFTLTKRASEPLISGAPLTYTISVTNTSRWVNATNVVVADPLPDGAEYISSNGCELMPGDVVNCVIEEIPANQSRQVTFEISTCQQSLINASYRVIASTQGVDSPPGPPLPSDLTSPTIQADFDYSPLDITMGDTVYFTDTSTTDGSPIITRTWDFGDGGTGNGLATNHIYTTADTYSAKLSVTDACGYTATKTKPIQVHTRVRKGYFPVIFRD